MKRPGRRRPTAPEQLLSRDDVGVTLRISRRQLALLRRVLLEEPRFSFTELARELGLSRAGLYYVIWSLEQRGLLRLQAVGREKPSRYRPYAATAGPVLEVVARLPPRGRLKRRH